MRCVLDCSVAIKWFIPEEDSDKAEKYLIEQQADRLSFVAPDVLVPEMIATLAKHVARSNIDLGPARYALAEFLSMHIELVPSGRLARMAFDLALAHSTAVYDALYIALAQREDLKVLTADDRMVRAFASLDRTVSLDAPSSSL